MALKLGKRPATYDRRDLKFSDFRAKLPVPLSALPTTWGHGMDFRSDVPAPQGWGMLGNGPQDDNSIDLNWAAAGGAGDCGLAGSAHEEMQGAHEASRPIPRFTSLNTLEQYSKFTEFQTPGQAYNLQTGDNDSGVDVRTLLGWRQKTGLTDADGKTYKIGAYVSLQPGDWQALREACYLFESVGIGFEFPSSAMDQFDSNQIWSVVPGAQIEGGHYVPVLGHPWPGLWTVVTWGRRQVATWDFLSKYVDETWAFIDFERYNKVTGQTAEHYKDVDLERYIGTFTQK